MPKYAERCFRAGRMPSTLAVALAIVLTCCAAESNVDLTRAEPGVVHRILDVESFEVPMHAALWPRFVACKAHMPPWIASHSARSFPADSTLWLQNDVLKSASIWVVVFTSTSQDEVRPRVPFHPAVFLDASIWLKHHLLPQC